MTEFSHLDSDGSCKMVDISKKKESFREAIASGRVFMSDYAFKRLVNNRIEKGNVLEAARIAGIIAAKRTSELIPLTHPLNVEDVSISFNTDNKEHRVDIQSHVVLTAKTGVEMEALLAVSIAALTIYDMCKALDKSMVISDIRLVKKKKVTRK